MEVKNSSNIFKEELANSNLTFKRIKFDRSLYYNNNGSECSDSGNYKYDTYMIECSGNNPIFLILEPETSDGFENYSDVNIKITLELVKRCDNNNDECATKDSSGANLKNNIFNDELEDDYELINNSVTSTVVSTPKSLSRDKIYKSNSKSETEIECENEVEYYCSYDKRSVKRKESLKRQLTSNPYIDICKNPEWPFSRKKNKVISKTEKSNLFAGSSNNNRNKSELKTNISIESSSVKKKSSRGRARQWLESLATLFDGIYTQRSTLGRNAGLGLFSDRHFEKNEIITEFVGWVIDRNEALRLRSEGKATHICDLIKPSLYLDGEKDPKPFIGGGSFANDGSTFLGGPGNNSKFWKWYDEREGRTRVFLKATQEIKPNEEIFVGYCKDYWVDFAEKDVIKHKPSNLSNESGTNDSGKKKRKNNPSLNTNYSNYKSKSQKSDSSVKSQVMSMSEFSEFSHSNKEATTDITDQEHNENIDSSNINDSQKVTDLSDSDIQFRSKNNENTPFLGSIF
ncbi:putative SET domain containing [Cryptosporidium xiaoi]|uniref:SET domain containing n=1 Tax=Cryptosporidium xiaoi TaxID=659607 RepID=A0AAV9XVV1_9CRYT